MTEEKLKQKLWAGIKESKKNNLEIIIKPFNGKSRYIFGDIFNFFYYGQRYEVWFKRPIQNLSQAQMLENCERDIKLSYKSREFNCTDYLQAKKARQQYHFKMDNGDHGAIPSRDYDSIEMNSENCLSSDFVISSSGELLDVHLYDESLEFANDCVTTNSVMIQKI